MFRVYAFGTVKTVLGRYVTLHFDMWALGPSYLHFGFWNQNPQKWDSWTLWAGHWLAQRSEIVGLVGLSDPREEGSWYRGHIGIQMHESQ